MAQNYVRETKPRTPNRITVTVTLTLDKAKYEQFRRMFDEQSWIEFVDYCVNGGHLDEILGENPELMASFLQKQSKRLREAKKA